jgi:hypothetical protein
MNTPNYFTKLQATRFERPMHRGLNHPMLIRAADVESGVEYLVVLKCNAGYSTQPLARNREVLSYLIARRLEIPTPIPVMVRIPQNFFWFASEHPKHSELLAKSEGWNFGTIHLGKGWKPWLSSSAAKKIAPLQIEDAFSYDAMIQNPDRKVDNPNLLWKDNQLMVFDFDKAFGYNQLHRTHPRPWQSIISLLQLPSHCLFPHVKKIKRGKNFVGQSLWDLIEEWKLAEKPSDLASLFPSEWRDLDNERLDLILMMEYLNKLCGNTDDFCRSLTTCLHS